MVPHGAMSELNPTSSAASGAALGRWVERVGVALGSVATLFAAATVAWPRALPASDAAGQMLAAAVHASPERYEGLYEPARALSTQAFVVLTAALTGPLDLETAARVVLLGGLLVLVASLATLAQRWGRSVGAAMALGAAAFVGWPYAMGYFSFLLALCTCAAAAAISAVLPRSTLGALAASAALLLAAWMHVGGALAGCVVFALGVLLGWQRGGMSPWRWGAVLPALVWCGVVALRWLRSDAADLLDVLPPQWATGELLELLPGAGAAAFSRFGPVVGLAALVALALGTLRGDGVRIGRTALVAAALLLGAVFAMPLHGGGFWYVSLPLVVLAVAVVPAVGIPRGAVGVAVAAAALGVTAHGLPNARYEGERIAAVVDRYPAGEALGRAYAVVFHPEPAVRMASGVVPFAATPLYAGITGPAWLPGVPAGTSPLHALRFADGGALLPDPVDPYRAWSRDCLSDPACSGSELAQADQIAVSAAAWDAVVLAGAPRGVVERLLARGFTSVADSRLVLRAAFSAIVFTFEVPAIAADSPLVLRASYPEAIGVFRTVDAPDGAARGEAVTLRLDHIPGGTVVVEAFADLDGDGEPDAGDYVFVQSREINVQPPSAVMLRADSTLGGPRP